MKTRIHVNQHNIRANSKGADLSVTIVVERVNINQLRAQRNKLLEFLNPSDEITGLINLLDYMLDVAEGYTP
jgi:hypothetical protein